MFRSLVVVLLVSALILVSCAAPAAVTQAPVQPAVIQTQAAAAPLATAEPVKPQEPAAETSAPALAETAPTPSPAPTQGSPAVAGGQPVVYKIVPAESQASYEVGETFFNQNNRFNLAVGTTSAIQGEITVDPANPANSSIGTITVDISQLKSDSGRRDNVIRERYLESAAYPQAVFKPTAIEGLPASYTPGQEVTFKVTGDLTVHQITQPVTFDVTLKGDAQAVTGTAVSEVLLSAFKVGPITIAGILGTEDKAKLVFKFVARP